MSTSNKFSPLGDLSKFPREIRDEIYKAVLPKKGARLQLFCKSPPEEYDGQPHVFQILQISRRIRREALEVLGNDIRFFVDCETFRHPFESVPLKDFISNIELVFDVEGWNTCVMVNRPYGETCTINPRVYMALDSFNGTQILRNTCVITFKGCVLLLHILFDVLLHLRYLTGFRMVTLDINKTPVPSGGLGPTSRNHTSYDFAGLIARKSGILKRTLGPAKYGELTDDRPYSIERGFGHQTVIFHPREFLAQKQRGHNSKADEMDSKLAALDVTS